MARVPLAAVVRNPAGNALSGSAGAQVWVYEYETTTEVSVYTAEVGGAPTPQPISPDENGELDSFWVEAPQQLTLHVEYASFSDDLAFSAILGTDLGGRELGYVDVDIGFATVSSAWPHFEDWPGLSMEIVAGVRPVYIEAYASACQASAVGNRPQLQITDETNAIKAACVASQVITASQQCGPLRASASLRDLVPGQSYTFKVRLGYSGGGANGAITAFAGAISGLGNSYLRALES